MEEFDDLRGQIAEAAVKAGVTDSRTIMSGEVVDRLATAAGLPSIQEQLRMSGEAQFALHAAAVKKNAARFGVSEHSQSMRKHTEQVVEYMQTGQVPARGKRVVGMVCGDEPPQERALLWVDLLLAPRGKAVLGQQAAWMTQTLIGYDALMKGSNADALECMCCFLGLASMVAREGHATAVVHALGERAASTAPSLCQWLAHLPVGQDYMYGGNWKAPDRSNERLKMSPLLTTPAFVKVLDALVRLLLLMADPQTEALHGQGAPFIAACLRSRHLPAAMRRLVQVIGRHDDDVLVGTAARSVETLDHLCENHPAFAHGLRAHPRAAAIFQAIARVAPEDAAATLVQRELAAQVRRLRGYCVHAITDREQPFAQAMRARDVTECDRCGAWCEKQQRCAGCKAVSYCDVACQKAAWKQHKKACRASQQPKAEKSK